MTRVFVSLILLYFAVLCFFAFINVSLVLMREKTPKLAFAQVVIFGLFPVLVLTQKGREKLRQIFN